ncbi:hypothetical protein GCM10020295_05160 [Streptomyces cinereospinus]
MRVVFTKGPGTSYGIAVHRGNGAALDPRNGPGGHPYLPHDLVHFLAEAEAGIELGVYGRPAAGDHGLFWPADPAERARAVRRRRTERVRPSPGHGPTWPGRRSWRASPCPCGRCGAVTWRSCRRT